MVFGVWTVVALGALVFVITTIEPKTNGVFAEIFFFSSLLLVATGVMTILGILGRLRTATGLVANAVTPAFRQGLLIAIAVCVILFLQRMRILQWWNLLLLGTILVLIDLAFSSKRGGR